MITTKCACGATYQVPQSFIGEPLPCEHCRQPVTLIAREGAMDQPAVRLTIQSGPGRQGEQFLIGGAGPIEIGKLDGKHIQLPGEQISRTHCRVMKTEMGWVIQDANSKNGLYINNQRVNSHVLSDGDLITAGEFQLIFNRLAGDIPAALTPEEIEMQRAASGPANKAFDQQSDEPEDLDSLELLPEETQLVEDPNDRLIFEAASKAARAPLAALPVDDTGDVFALAQPKAAPPPKAPPIAAAVPMDGPVCPSCQKRLPRGGIICVGCGIDVHTGRSLITSKGFDEDEFAETAHKWIDIFSLLVPLGIFPIASEAFGTRKPKVILGVAIVTFVISLLFYFAINSTGGWSACKNLMLWCGDPSHSVIDQILADQEKRIASVEARIGRKFSTDEIAHMRAHLRAELAQSEQVTHPGEFRWYQVLTNAFLHDFSGPYNFFMHFGGNCLFLIVFGSGVNAAIGNSKTAVVYMILAIVASVAEVIAYASGAPKACLGASGAIMGLAGMYFVLFPVHKLYMTIWLRFFYITKCFYHIWRVRGFWVVLAWITFNDIIPTLRGSHDHVGHWAHLGGFMAGVLIAFGLLLTRTVDARGGDILSVLFGKRAWTLLGKPADHVAVV